MEHRVDKSIDAEQIADQVRLLVNQLQIMGRTDLLLRAITVPTLEQLRTEAARGTLSKLIITKDFRLILANGNRDVVLTPVHRAVYLFFLKHPEGIEFKRLSEYHHELFAIYTHIMPDGDAVKMKETVDRLTILLTMPSTKSAHASNQPFPRSWMTTLPATIRSTVSRHAYSRNRQRFGSSASSLSLFPASSWSMKAKSPDTGYPSSFLWELRILIEIRLPLFQEGLTTFLRFIHCIIKHGSIACKFLNACLSI